MKKIAVFLCSFFVPAALFAQSGPSAGRERGQVTAEPVWRQALGGAIMGLPTVQAQSAVVALDGGNLRAYSTGGTFLWNYSARGRISPFVTRSREGTSYISRTSGALIAVNRAGRELWRRTPGGPLSGPVIPGWDGRLFVPTDKKISCYTASGNLLWSRSFTERITVSPILDHGGGVMLALENGEVFRINPFGGSLNWRLLSPPLLLVSLSPPVGRTMPRVLALHHNGSMEILGNPEEWYMPADPGAARISLPRLSSPPLAATSRGNLAAVTQSDGQTLLISVDEGTILWTGESHISVRLRSGLAAAEDKAAMLYDERGVYVLSPNGATGFAGNGRRLWFTTLENAAAIPAFGDDGVLYSGGRDWILSAYKLEDRSRFQKQSVYGPAPEGSYGTASPLPSPWADFHFRFDENELRTRLDRIGGAIQAGGVGETELAWTGYLMETIAGEYGSPGASVTHPAVQLRDRVRALRLLASVGSRETIPFLTGVFKKDGDPVIKAAAAEAIGLIGVDPDGVAIQSFFEALSPASLKDEQALLAVASATGALCRFSGPPLSDTGVKILNLLAGSGQSGVVQQRARREMATLR